MFGRAYLPDSVPYVEPPPLPQPIIGQPFEVYSKALDEYQAAMRKAGWVFEDDPNFDPAVAGPDEDWDLPEDVEDTVSDEELDEEPPTPKGRSVAQGRSAPNPNRYARLPQMVLCDHALKPTDKLVYAVMAMFSSNGATKISLGKIAEEANLHERTVRTAISNLGWGKHIEQSFRVIVVKKDGQFTRRKVPYYILNSPVFKKKEDSK